MPWGFPLTQHFYGWLVPCLLLGWPLSSRAIDISQTLPSPPIPGQNSVPELPSVPGTPVLPSGSPELLPSQQPAELIEQQIEINKIQILGSTILTAVEIADFTHSLEGRKVTLAELVDLTDRITQLYLQRGYINSRAFVPNQSISSGQIQIQIVEGSLANIEIEGTQRVSQDYIKNRINLAQLKPLNQIGLEDQLRLLQADPLFQSVTASLRPGPKPGQAILAIQVEEANELVFGINVDNYSPPSVGGERTGGSITYRNITGIGDSFTAAATTTFTGGSQQYDLNYRIPVNAMNGTVQFRYAPNTYRITDPAFASFGIRGNSDLYDVSFRQPIIRTPREELALSIGLTHQSGQTFLFENIPMPFGPGADANGVTRTSVVKLGQEYISRDVQGAWAVRSQFNLGTSLFGATSNPAPLRSGEFFSWSGQAQRVQRLDDNQLLIMQGDLQLSANPLLPSQQFVIGGGQSVRGYRQNARSGDNGFRFSIEDRITIARNETGASTFQIAPFVDTGAVWNTGNLPLPRDTFLSSAGVGFLWNPVPNLNMRLDYGVPLVNLGDRGNNIQDHGLHFTINAQF